MKNKAVYPFIGTVLIVIGLMLGLTLSRDNVVNGGSDKGKYEQKLADILEVLDRDYVDSIDKEKLFEETIVDLLHSLDPHSNYIAAEQLKRMNESIEGKFGGVGVRFTILRDTLNITNVIINSPADKAGVKKFDQIIEVDDSLIAGVGLKNTGVQALLKGKAGTDVKVKVLRRGGLLNKKITRGMVPIESITAAYMITDEIGYIRLSQFSIQSANEFYMAALQLKSEGMKKLIFDLRFNGGGVMGSAVSIVDALLEQGKPIVSTKGKNNPEETLYSENKPLLGGVDLAVLINGSSASASEIVAGAIQDNDRGTIIGRRSFGKGLVQQDINLKDGSNLRLTVSRYYTPTGRCIQKPYTGDYNEYMMDEVNRYENGELYELDSSLLVDSLKFTTPQGKTVYGGGGIMPDIFVPLDTTGGSTYLRRLRYSGVFNDFAYDFARNHTQEMNSFSSLEEFDKAFKVDKNLLSSFTSYASNNHDISLNKQELSNSKQQITENIKAEIARQKWLEEGAYYIFNESDREVKVAIETLNNQ
jgi:carboxyl-terminal processing protease